MKIIDMFTMWQSTPVDNSRHYRMISEKGYVQFSVYENKEGRIFLKELEKYAYNNKLVVLVINRVTNPALEKILKDNYYREYYSDIDGNMVDFNSGIRSFKKNIIIKE